MRPIRKVTVTSFRYVSMPAGLRRHLVGKTLRDVSYSAPKIAPSIAMRPDNNEKLRKQFAPG